MSSYGSPATAEDTQLATVDYLRWILDPNTKSSSHKSPGKSDSKALDSSATTASGPKGMAYVHRDTEMSSNQEISGQNSDSPRGLSSGEVPSPVKPAKQISCTQCQSRKIKCDRAKPSCGHCIKSKLLPCEYRAPAPPRRGKRKPAADVDLLARLRNCEDLLRQKGVDLQSLGLGSIIDESTESAADPEQPKKKRNLSSNGQESTTDGAPTAPMKPTNGEHVGKVIIENGGTRYVESDLWRGIGAETNPTDPRLLNVVEHTDDNASVGSNCPVGEDFLFGTGVTNGSLASLHPSIADAGILWTTFLENCDPLLKVLHIPTFEPMMWEAINKAESISSGLEALLFSIYTLTINSMSEADCLKAFATPKMKLFTRYESATKKAFTRAGMLISTDFRLVQACVLWLHAIRDYYHPHALWVLSGVGLRIAQRAGLHREKALRNYSPFDAEMRRRTWWALMSIDSRAAELSGSAISVFNNAFDTETPRNLNDRDINPDMQTLPESRTGATEMIFVSLRHEIGRFFRDNVHCGTAGTGGITMPQLNDAKIDEFEQLLEHKFLRFCDALYPLHYITSVVGRACIGVMRLMLHHPCQCPEGGKNMTVEEKNFLFEQSTRSVRYQHLIALTPALGSRYMWHCDAYFPWHAFIYLVTTICKRGDKKQAQEAWEIVQKTFEIYPKMITDLKKPLHVALGNLVIKAWDATGDWFPADKTARLQDPSAVDRIPEFITKLRAQRAPRASPTSLDQLAAVATAAPGTVTNYTSQLAVPGSMNTNANWLTGNGHQPVSDTYDMGASTDLDVPSFDMVDLSPEAWSEWSKLLAGTQTMDFSMEFQNAPGWNMYGGVGEATV